MPLTSPAYPQGPYRFVNREFLVITYRTDPRSAARRGARAAGDRRAAGQVRIHPHAGFDRLRRLYRGRPGHPGAVRQGARAAIPTPCISTTARRSSAAARCGAFPKKLRPAVAGGRAGHAGRHARLRPGAGRDRHHGLQARDADHDAVLKSLAAPNFLLKIIPHVDGTPRICELVAIDLRTSRSKARGAGRRRSSSRPRAGAGRRSAGARSRIGHSHPSPT